MKCKFCSFEERLAAQRREREMAATELGFKKPLSKEEKIEKKKQRLAAIGILLRSFWNTQAVEFWTTMAVWQVAFTKVAYNKQKRREMVSGS